MQISNLKCVLTVVFNVMTVFYPPSLCLFVHLRILWFDLQYSDNSYLSALNTE